MYLEKKPTRRSVQDCDHTGASKHHLSELLLPDSAAQLPLLLAGLQERGVVKCKPTSLVLRQGKCPAFSIIADLLAQRAIPQTSGCRSFCFAL